MTRAHLILTRQILLFLIVGALQLAVDSAMFIGLSAAGVAVIPANIAGRLTGASLGFWLNGRYTFADAGRPRLSGLHLRRFILAWLLLTVFSTALLYAIEARSGLRVAWFAKPLVEALSAAISFVVSRLWVFR